MPLEPDVRAEVIGLEEGDGNIRLVSTRGVLAYTGFRSLQKGKEIQLTVHVDDRESTVINRGLAWVTLRPDVPARFQFVVNREHGLEENQLKEALESIPPKVAAFMGGVLLGDPNPPYDQA